MFKSKKSWRRMLPLVLVVLFCALLAGTAFAGHLPRTTYIGWVGKSVVISSCPKGCRICGQ